MGQVPKSEAITESSYILIIGSGRIARHLTFYFESLNIKVKNWNRKKNQIQELKTLFVLCDRCLLLIKDDAIDEFIKLNSYLKSSKTIHCSGALDIEGIECLHPLMTFSEDLFPLSFYQQIPWAHFNVDFQLKDLHSKILNTTFYVPKSKKILYHSLCVFSGNFVQILWIQTLHEWTAQLALSPDLLKPYTQKVTENFWQNASTNNGIAALTGPIARKDFSTIQKHLDTLKSSPLIELYHCFLKTTLSPDELKHIGLLK